MLDKFYNIVFEEVFEEIFQHTHPKDVRKKLENEFLHLAKLYYAQLHLPYATESTLDTLDYLDFVERDLDGTMITKPMGVFTNTSRQKYRSNQKSILSSQFAILVEKIKKEQPINYFLLETHGDIAIYMMPSNGKNKIYSDQIQPELFELLFIIVLNKIKSTKVTDFLNAQLSINFKKDKSKMNAFLIVIKHSYFRYLSKEKQSELQELIEYWTSTTKPDLEINNNKHLGRKNKLDGAKAFRIIYELDFFSKIDICNLSNHEKEDEIKRVHSFISGAVNIQQSTILRYLNGLKAKNDRKNIESVNDYDEFKRKIHNELDKANLKVILDKVRKDSCSKDESEVFWKDVKTAMKLH